MAVQPKGSSFGLKYLGSLVALMLAIGLLAASQPLRAVALPSGTGSSVSARADATYEFSAPSGGMLASGRSRHELGAFKVGRLLLHDGEQLQIVIVTTPFSKSGDSGGTVPFQVRFSNPGLIGMSNSGEHYDLGITLDPRSLARAGSGDYRGSVEFRVLTHPGGAVVWAETVQLSFTQPVVSVPTGPTSGWLGGSGSGSPDGRPDEPGGADDDGPSDSGSQGQADPSSPPGDSGSGGTSGGLDDLAGADEDSGWVQWLAGLKWSPCCIPLLLLLPLLILLLIRRRRQQSDDPSSSPIE